MKGLKKDIYSSALVLAKSIDDMTEQEKKETRSKTIGSSDIGAILGVDSYKSEIDLWLQKLGRKTEEERELEWEYRLQAGHDAEPRLRKYFMDKTGHKVHNRNATLVNSQIEWATCNPDGIVTLAYDIPGAEKGDRGLLEIKTASHWAGQEWKDDLIPDKYFAQVQWQLFVTGLKFAYIVFESDYFPREPYLVQRDDEQIEYMVDKATKFIEHVKNRTVPEPDGSRACDNAINEYYPPEEAQEEEIELSAYVDEVEELKDLKSKIKALQEEAKLKEQTLKLALGDHTIGLVGDRKITWKPVFKKGFDKTRFQKEEPEIYGKYIKETSYRTLRV